MVVSLPKEERTCWNGANETTRTWSAMAVMWTPMYARHRLPFRTLWLGVPLAQSAA